MRDGRGEGAMAERGTGRRERLRDGDNRKDGGVCGYVCSLWEHRQESCPVPALEVRSRKEKYVCINNMVARTWSNKKAVLVA